MVLNDGKVHVQWFNGHSQHLLGHSQISGHGLWPCLYLKQQQALSIELIGIAGLKIAHKLARSWHSLCKTKVQDKTFIVVCGIQSE